MCWLLEAFNMLARLLKKAGLANGRLPKGAALLLCKIKRN